MAWKKARQRKKGRFPRRSSIMVNTGHRLNPDFIQGEKQSLLQNYYSHTNSFGKPGGERYKEVPPTKPVDLRKFTKHETHHLDGVGEVTGGFPPKYYVEELQKLWQGENQRQGIDRFKHVVLLESRKVTYKLFFCMNEFFLEKEDRFLGVILQSEMYNSRESAMADFDYNLKRIRWVKELKPPTPG